MNLKAMINHCVFDKTNLSRMIRVPVRIASDTLCRKIKSGNKIKENK